ncbi:MAG: hypothetical protein ACOX17_00510 [Christensenellales bacterium]
MKKLSIIFTALLLVFLLSACSLIPAGLLPFKNILEQTEDPVSSLIEAPSAEEADAPETEEPEDEEPWSDPPESDEPGSEDPVIAVPEYGEITFEELVVVDNDECSIKITKIEPEGPWGYTLKVHLENKSDKKTYTFSAENGSAVNSVETNLFLYAEVAPGKKALEEIIVGPEGLLENGVTDYTDIELTFTVTDSDDWYADPAAEVTVHVYPYGKEKATVFVREIQPTDTVLFDDENVTVIVTGYENDPDWGYYVNLYLVNKTDKTLMFFQNYASVNGYMCDPCWSWEVRPGKRSFTYMCWPKETLDEIDVTEVEELEMLFIVYAPNADGVYTDTLIEEVVTLTP